MGAVAVDKSPLRSLKFTALLLHLCRERIQRQRPQQIPTHPAFRVSHAIRRDRDPFEISGLGQALQLQRSGGVSGRE